MEQTKLKITGIIKTILHDNVEFALIYGSFYTDRFILNKSDIDVAVFLHPDKMKTFQSLFLELNKQLENDIDLILLNNAEVILANQIIINGKVIINNHPKRFLEYKLKTLGQYSDFKIFRRPLEQNIVRNI